MCKYYSIALMACAVAAFIEPRFAAAQQTSPKLEACTKWDVQKGNFGFSNNCGEAVTVLFTTLPVQKTIAKVIKPGERFDAGLAKKTEESGWMSTRCPVGFVPSVPFAVENREAIIASRYECVKR